METRKQQLLVKIIIIAALLCLSWLIGYFTGVEQGQKKAIKATLNQQQNINSQGNLPQVPPILGNDNQNINSNTKGLPQVPPLIK